ncbi:MAG: hypothetical protein ACLRI8_02840 [Agathobacter rectalis]
MPIYFGSNFAREPFQFDSVGNDWEQESVTAGGIRCTIIYRRRRVWVR